MLDWCPGFVTVQMSHMIYSAFFDICRCLWYKRDPFPPVVLVSLPWRFFSRITIVCDIARCATFCHRLADALIPLVIGDSDEVGAASVDIAWHRGCGAPSTFSWHSRSEASTGFLGWISFLLLPDVRLVNLAPSFLPPPRCVLLHA